MKNRWIVTVLVLIGTNAWGAVNLSSYFGKSYAVVIGIQNYQNENKWPEVVNAKHDADDMAAFFNEQGFSDVKVFIDEQATIYNITYYLENLANDLKHDDRIVFYFSGHGETEKKGGRDWGYIIPYDGKSDSASWLSMDKLRELAAKLGNARHQLFILDSCFGGMIEPKGSAVSSASPFYIDELTKRRVRLYMTAGGANEKAPMRSEVSKNSHYTAHLLRGLRNGFADKDFDGIITTSELEGYLLMAASIKGMITPRWGTIDGHENSEFIISSPQTERTIVSSPVPVAGPTKGNRTNNDNDEDKHDWERLSKKGVDGLKSYLLLHPNGKWADEARDRTARLQPKPEPQRPSSPAVVKRTLPKEEQDRLESEWQREQHANRTVSKEQQAQALYEWQKDVSYSSSSETVENFLQRFPVGSHVPDAERKLSELRALGQ